MKSTDTKLILNITVEDDVLVDRVKAAIDDCVKRITVKDLDDAVEKIIVNRVNQFITMANSHPYNTRINSRRLEDIVKEATDDAMEKMVKENITNMIQRKLAEMLAE